TVNGASAAPTNVSGLGSGTATGTLNLTSDGTNAVVCTATDGASPPISGAAPGSMNTATVKLDTVPPTITLSAAADSCSQPGANGWCRGTQVAGFTAADATAGLADPAQKAFTRSAAGDASAVSIASGLVC